MPGIQVSKGFFMEFSGVYEVGSLPPPGYVDRSDWADAQLVGGLSQSQCPMCRNWKFPQELVAGGCRSCVKLPAGDSSPSQVQHDSPVV
jgi:hypothetical protein